MSSDNPAPRGMVRKLADPLYDIPMRGGHERKYYQPFGQPFPIQDAGGHADDENVPVYHTHGLRQYMGTCKIHCRLGCPHLVNWRPGRRLGKTVMREWMRTLGSVPPASRCRTCWPTRRT